MAPTAVPSKDVLSFGPFRLTPGERFLTRNGAPVELGARALDILIALVSRPNEVVSKRELLSRVWPDVTVEESSLRFHMAGLRKALGDGKDGARYVTTLAGRGYCFVAPVVRPGNEAEASTSFATEFPHANLPGRLAHMVGRDEDVLRISNHLIAARFVSIVGSGGVGKTTVAIAVGHHLVEAFKGAVLIVDLSMLSDPGLVATAIASMLGLSVQSEDATPALIAYLRSRRMLLILDTCEHLIDAVATTTSRIYAEAPDVHILATSREVLQVGGEHVYRLDALTSPPEDLEDMGVAAQKFPAPRLFIERAAASGARLDLSDAEVAIIVRICRKLDGVALAIELADAALAVVTGNDTDQSQVLGAIDNLVGKSMVATRPIGAMMRYRLLDMTRAYILSIAIDDTEAADLSARHAAYYRRWLEQYGGDWPTLSTGPERSPHFAALNNTRSALEWCFGEHGDVVLGIKLAAAAAPFFLTMSLLPECYRWSQRAIGALDNTTRGGAEEMQLQSSLGVASMYIHGPSEAARAAMNRSLVIAETRSNVLSQVAILSTLSLFCTRQGEFKIGLGHAKRARAVAGTIEGPDATALARAVLGIALQFIGDLTGARSELEAAFQHRSSTQRAYLGVDEHILAGLGLAPTLWAQGFPAQAVEQARRTFDDAKLSGNPTSLAATLSLVAHVSILVGGLRSAEEYADWLIAFGKSHSLGPYLHLGGVYKGTLAVYGGNPRAGVQTLQDCLKQLRAVHYEMLTTEFNIVLTQGLMAIGRGDEGMALIDETIRRIEESGQYYLLPEALRMRGCAILASPECRIDDVGACFAQSLELSRRQGARAWELRTAISLARLWAKRGEPEDGRKLLQPILEHFTEGRDTADLRTATCLLAELAESQ